MLYPKGEAVGGQDTKGQVMDFLIDEWLPSIQHTVRTNTFLSYKGHIRRHVSPFMGSMLLEEIDGPSLNSLYRELLLGSFPGGIPLSPATVRRVHATLHRAFRDAVRWKRLDYNPADSADPPKSTADGHAEMQTWTSGQLRSFLTFARTTTLYSMWLVLATTGMRRGEVLGLRWRDIDFDHRVLAVRQGVVDAGGKLYVAKPKTKKSSRRIALDEVTLTELKRMAAEVHGEPKDSFVFPGNAGLPMRPTSVSKMFRKLVEESGLPRIRLHDLRHTSATLALEAGIHPKIVSERLGHSTISFTLDIYSHAVPHMQEEAANQLGRLIFPTSTEIAK